jgi:dTDP-glucose 4,6-dehydratase
MRITVLTRDPETFGRKAPHLANYPGFSFVAGDVSNFQTPTGSFTHLIHAATDASAELNENNPLRMYDTILQGTRRALVRNQGTMASTTRSSQGLVAL